MHDLFMTVIEINTIKDIWAYNHTPRSLCNKPLRYLNSGSCSLFYHNLSISPVWLDIILIMLVHHLSVGPLRLMIKLLR